MSATNNTERTMGVDTIDGHQAAVFISEMGHCTEAKLSPDELKAFIKDCQKVLRQLESKPKTYKSLEEAQEAMDRGETVCIEMDESEINPALVQFAQDLQDREQLKRWKQQNG